MATQDNKIPIFQHNAFSFDVSVYNINNITGYTPYLTVKKKTTDASTVLFKTGTVTDASGTLHFSGTGTDASLAAGDYIYDITIEQGDTSVFTIVKDIFSIGDGVRY